ncbi:non-hydrolyzing UDP-N-acetylglucosamine 2-epimerase [Serinicoccus sediminis]|uniref:non-hydrolyzing UDP-N-acetylglucosamine 2-epimerase n=1 Tax=Serinicoccus sediminis TaxID=2306021 RepID=UPI00102209A3|nr:UDP-N-acetylglucosamine 2-epimerase (non-hydrolyzing) [Serinicoccus sediminis]
MTPGPLRVMTVYGTRPEAIKVAPLLRGLGEDPRFDPVAVVSGQHREMLDQVNQIFGIVPDVDLDVFAHGQTLNGLMAKVFERLDPVLVKASPHALVVQGDTSTVAAAAMAAFYREIPVVHLEAGLRSGDLRSPFPEEANRRVTSQLASLHLAPTATARDNLLRENITADDVVVTGNTVIDALLHTSRQGVPFSDPRLVALEEGRRVLLVTTHRRESWGTAMQGVGRALRVLAERYPDIEVVLPVHRNPLVREALLPALDGLPNVLVTEPLAYGEFTRLMAASTVVLTDSGGVQEEAPSLGKPVLVLRSNTERPEAVTAGTVRLIGTQEHDVVRQVSLLLDDPGAYREMAHAVNPYGDGNATTRCVAALAQLLGVGEREPDFAG